MNERFANRIAAIMMISVLLLLYLSPVVSYASGTFITPGKAMTPGKFYTPGKPITGGTFMIPGNVYEPGKTYNPGEVKGNGQLPSASGQPIFPGTPYNNGSFLIPNAPTSPVPNLFLPFKPMDPGNPIEEGNGGPNSNGKVPTGGEMNSGGKVPTGGDKNNGSKLPGGSTIDGNGFGPKGEMLVPGPGTTEPGKDNSGDNNKISKAKFGEETQWTLDTIFLQHRDTSRGLFGQLVGGVVDAKNFLLTFLNKDVAGPVLAAAGGFNIQPMPGGKSGYSVTAGKSKYNNKLLNNIYQEYKSYYDGKVKSLGAQTSRIKDKTLKIFLENKNLRPKGMNPFTYIGKSTLSAVNEAWNPLSKGFLTKNNLLKWSGPLNYALSSANSLFDFSSKGKYRDYGYKSTEFAADLSVELGIGVATTALSSVASSMALGAVAGSAVPVVGTIAGAAAGLVVGLGTNYFINGTRRGIRIKNSVKKGVNKAIEGGAKLFRKLGDVFG